MARFMEAEIRERRAHRTGPMVLPHRDDEQTGFLALAHKQTSSRLRWCGSVGGGGGRVGDNATAVVTVTAYPCTLKFVMVFQNFQLASFQVGHSETPSAHEASKNAPS